MSDKAVHLVNDILSDSIEKDPIRAGFGRGLLEAGKRNENIVGLSADLTGSTKMDLFADEFPQRFVEIGVAEQNLATVGSGMAAMGKIPFITSYAAFSPGRNWEQIKTTISLNNQPVKIIGSHAGLYTGPDGATHQMLEDLAIMRPMPNMVVIAPGDAVEAYKATLAIAEDERPAYMRVTREATPVFTTDKTPFNLSRAYVLHKGSDLTIVSTGAMTYPTLVASEKLFSDGVDVEVIHCPVIKPLDAVTILQSVQKTGAVMTIEEGQINGGLGSAVAEVVAEHHPVKLMRLGIMDRYGESGSPEELFDLHELTPKHIAKKAHQHLNELGRQ